VNEFGRTFERRYHVADDGNWSTQGDD